MLLCQETPSVLVVYASQQGNSKAIAEDLCEECSNRDISASISCISSLGKDPALLLNKACVIFIAATTGDGEPPDTARKFWRLLNKSFSPAAAAAGQLLPFSGGGLQTLTNEPQLKNSPTDESLTAKEEIPASANQPLLDRDTKVTLASANQPLLDRGTKVTLASANQPLLDGDTKVTLASANQPLLDGDTKVTPASAHKPLFDLDTKVARVPAAANQPLLVRDSKLTPVASRPSEPLVKAHPGKESATLVGSSQINCITPLALGTAFKDKNFNELSYTILGLGDTNYTNFCNFGKNLDQKLHKLGAKRFYSCGWADDGTGLELVIEPWLEGLWDALPARLSLIASRPRLREAEQGQCCDGDTTDNRRLMEDSKNCPPDQGIDKEVRNNAEVCRIEKLNGGTAILIGSKKDVRDVNILEDGLCLADAASSSQSKKGVADSAVISNKRDCDGDKLELLLSTENLGSSGSAQNESNFTFSKSEKDVSADEVCREVSKLSVRDTRETENFGFSIDNAWKENHILLQCELPSDLKLTIPKRPAYGNLILDYDEDELCMENNNSYQNDACLPSAGSAVYNCDIILFRKLSEGEPGKEVKKVVEVVAQLPLDCSMDYEPGDSLALLVRNDAQEVSLVMDLIRLPTPDKAFTLSKAPSAKRAVPAHLPSRCTTRELFTSCVDYKCLPKKAMLLLLLDSATDPQEKRCLQELVCREGAELYKKKVLDNRLSFFDVLTVFSSCRPQLSSLLEVLPRLIPRAYSLTSSPLNPQRRVTFAYSLTVIPATPHVFRKRHGVCTGLLDRISKQIFNAQNDDREVSESPKTQLSLYLRNSNSFRLPEDPAVPVILIGPGCGVAPLVGFLRHRHLQIAGKQLDVNQLGTSWLFFGCRYARADELYRDELEEFHRSGILTHLRKCFSREPLSGAASGTARYVQDAVRAESEALFAAITEREARVYVCGDAANMAKDVLAAFADVLAERLGSADQGIQYVAQMQNDGRYIQDVWT